MIRIRAPGRICLFGEHQDYLNYPTISMAISKYIYLEAKRQDLPKFIIDLPDVDEHLEIQLNNKEIDYFSKRDYLRSSYNQFIRKGIKFSKGYLIKITGDIPISAGAASSSALVIAWLYFLSLINDTKSGIELKSLALEGYNAEVNEFGEAGGMMDHFTSTYGYINFLESEIIDAHIMNLKNQFEGFVLGNSFENKDTVEDIFKVKKISIKAFKIINKIMPNFDRFSSTFEEIEQFLPNLENKYRKKIIGNIINRDITLMAKNLIFDQWIPPTNPKNLFYQKLGALLNKHHEQLRDNIEISTQKIDNIITDCLEAGAFGAKINGSGFGGTMFALSPGNEQTLKDSIEKNDAKAYIIKTSNGVELY
jgi:galactokinase